MNDKRNWTTPKLTPLSGESAEGAVITGMWPQAGAPKTNAGGVETRMTMREMTGGVTVTVYEFTGPS